MFRIWKRMLFSLFWLALLIIGFVLMDNLPEGDFSDFCAVIVVISTIAFIISFAWGLLKSLRQTIRVKKGIEPVPAKSTNSLMRIVKQSASSIKNNSQEFKELNPFMKKRSIKFLISGILCIAVFVLLIIKFYESTFLIGIATLFLIAGVTLMIFASPKLYNNNGLVKMIPLDTDGDIEKIFEDVKTMETSLGSPYLGRIKMMKNTSIIFGPNKDGMLIFCYLSKSKRIMWISEAMYNCVDEVYKESLHPYEERNTDNLSLKELVCFDAGVWLLKSEIYDIFIDYFKTGKIRNPKDYSNASVYTFDEKFKLLGQQFSMKDLDGKEIFFIDGTFPLVTFKINDAQTGTELFKVVKQVDQILTTYNFYKDGVMYGSFQKDFTFYKDHFTMETTEGTLELVQNNGYVGNNYNVYINGSVIGSIMDNLKLSLRNIVFDNSILFVYDTKYTSLIAAFAVMVAREIARERERSSSSSSND